MDKSMLELIINMVIYFLGVIIVYFLCHSLIEKKLKLTVKLWVLAIIFGVIIGVVGLSNIRKVMRNYEGIIYYGDEYQSDYKSNYLTITLDIGYFSPYKDQLLNNFTNFQEGSLFLVKM